MRTPEEVQEMLTEFESYTPMSGEQMIGLAASIQMLKWVQGEDVFN